MAVPGLRDGRLIRCPVDGHGGPLTHKSAGHGPLSRRACSANLCTAALARVPRPGEWRGWFGPVPTRFSGPRPPGGEDFSRFAKVSVDDLGLVVAGQHDFAVRDRDRVDLDIRHPAVPGGRL